MKEENRPYWLCNKGTTSDRDDFKDRTTVEFINEVRLIKLKDGRYQFSEAGAFRSLLTGQNYTLIDDKIGFILQKHVPDQVEISNCVIFRRATGEEWNNYCESKIKNEIDYKQYDTTESSGLKIYCILHNLIYVSPDLKKIIEEELEDLSDIEFKRGLPLLAGK